MVASVQLDVSANVKDRIRTALKSGFDRFPRFTAAKWLLESEPEPVEDDDRYEEMNLEYIFFSSEFENASDHRTFLSTLHLDEEKIVEIAKATIGQFKNRTYSMLKKFRLTASNFGLVLAAVHRNSYPLSLYQRLLGGQNLDRVCWQFDTIYDTVVCTGVHSGAIEYFLML